MTKKEIEKIKGRMEKPPRKSQYGFKEMKKGETKRIPMVNGDEKTKALASLRNRCSQENKEEKENNPENPRQYTAWCDHVGIYYKRTA